MRDSRNDRTIERNYTPKWRPSKPCRICQRIS